MSFPNLADFLYIASSRRSYFTEIRTSTPQKIPRAQPSGQKGVLPNSQTQACPLSLFFIYFFAAAKLWWWSCSFFSGSSPASVLCTIARLTPPVMTICSQVWIHLSWDKPSQSPLLTIPATKLNKTWFCLTCYRRTTFAFIENTRDIVRVCSWDSLTNWPCHDKAN